jgi:hypothetical protein
MLGLSSLPPGGREAGREILHDTSHSCRIVFLQAMEKYCMIPFWVPFFKFKVSLVFQLILIEIINGGGAPPK